MANKQLEKVNERKKKVRTYFVKNLNFRISKENLFVFKSLRTLTTHFSYILTNEIELNSQKNYIPESIHKCMKTHETEHIETCS